MSVAKHFEDYGVRTKWQTHLTYLNINSLPDINVWHALSPLGRDLGNFLRQY